MALVNTFGKAGQNSLAARFDDLLITLRTRLEQRKIYRETLRELMTLSDRELNDLGLNRSTIRRVAWQAAYDK